MTPTLLTFYKHRVKEAACTEKSLIFAIPQGSHHEVVDVFTHIFVLCGIRGAEVHTYDELDIFQNSALVFMPLLNPRSEDEDKNDLKNYMLRNGYARDRVIAIGKIKHALMVSTDQRQQTTLRHIYNVFKNFEYHVKKNPDDMQKQIKRIQRRHEDKMTETNTHPDSIRMQTSLFSFNPLIGNTLHQIDAVVNDPYMQDPQTIKICYDSMGRQTDRDLFLGTETFISVTFQPIYNKTSIDIDTDTQLFTAMVSIHDSTGSIQSIGFVENNTFPNAMIVYDAVSFCVHMHNLITKCNRREALLMEHVNET